MAMVGAREPSHAVPTPDGKYVYCIIRSLEHRAFGPIRIGGPGGEVYPVHHQDLAAIVSDTPVIATAPSGAQSSDPLALRPSAARRLSSHLPCRDRSGYA